jgi:proteasome lid subunit RPN8/RPN11
MISIPVVPSCPYTRVGQGLLHIAHPVLSIFAGAVHDRIEWIALLTGTRSPDGMEVMVTGVRVPLQERSHASCELVREEPLTPEVVGVVHSHHSMDAAFSTIDDSTLNPRFPLSIVVARNSHTSTDSEKLFGFNYQAEGRVPLPCGSIGIIAYLAVPSPMLDIWPEVAEFGYEEPDTTVSLFHCPHTTRTLAGITQTCKTACGIENTQPAQAIFGNDSKEFMTEVQQKTQRSKIKNYNIPQHYDYTKSFESQQDQFLQHWGNVRDY